MNLAIYNAMATAVAGFAQQHASPELRVAYPGLHFDPPDSGIWLELRWFQNGSDEYGIANDGPSVPRGFFRLIVCQRPGAINEAVGLAEAIISNWSKGTYIGPARIDETPSLGGPVEEPNRVSHPVTIRYWASR